MNFTIVSGQTHMCDIEGSHCIPIASWSEADIKHQQQLETQSHVETMMDKQIALADKIAAPIAFMYCATVVWVAIVMIAWAWIRQEERIRRAEFQSKEQLFERQCARDERIAEVEKNSADEAEEDQ